LIESSTTNSKDLQERRQLLTQRCSAACAWFDCRGGGKVDSSGLKNDHDITAEAQVSMPPIRRVSLNVAIFRNILEWESLRTVDIARRRPTKGQQY